MKVTISQTISRGQTGDRAVDISLQGRELVAGRWELGGRHKFSFGHKKDIKVKEFTRK